MNNHFEEYTEDQFLAFVKSFLAPDGWSESKVREMVFHFEAITEHPRGSDLLFWPVPGEDSSPEGIVNTVKTWRAANGKPGFKQP